MVSHTADEAKAANAAEMGEPLGELYSKIEDALSPF
jgi:hypothetical protein